MDRSQIRWARPVPRSPSDSTDRSRRRWASSHRCRPRYYCCVPLSYSDYPLCSYYCRDNCYCRGYCGGCDGRCGCGCYYQSRFAHLSHKNFRVTFRGNAAASSGCGTGWPTNSDSARQPGSWDRTCSRCPLNSRLWEREKLEIWGGSVALYSQFPKYCSCFCWRSCSTKPFSNSNFFCRSSECVSASVQRAKRNENER